MGLLENSKHGAGYSEILAPKTYGNGVSTAAVKIQGQVPANVKYESPSNYHDMYGVPTPGTGNVGADCDPLKAFRSMPFWYTADSTPHYFEGSSQPSDGKTWLGPFDAADHPCNWNKIKVGESVSVPLYYSTTDVNSGCPADPAVSGSYVCNLITSQSSDSFILRVRTPCDNGDEMCLASGRFDFDTGNINPTYGINEPIMSWQITGVDLATHKSLVLGPNIIIFGNPPALKSQSTIIHEFKLNGSQQSTTNPFEVLYQTSNGTDLDKCSDIALNFLMNQPTFCSNWGSNQIIKPLIKLSVIQSMKANPAQDTIPYLEYQFLSDFATSAPPTDTSQTITSEGFSGEFKWTLEVKKPQGGGLLEYVIQQ